MAKFERKWERIQRLKLDRLIEDLETDRAKLVFVRENPHVLDAIRLFLAHTPTLSKADREDLRTCMGFLTPVD